MTTDADSTWSGFLVLRGTGDLSPLIAPSIQHASEPVDVLLGDSKEGNFRERSVSVESMTDLIAEAVAKPYFTMIFGKPREANHLYVRNTTLRLWGQGAAMGGFPSIIDGLVNLNKHRKDMDSNDNYAQHIAKHVVNPVGGKYAATIAYIAHQTSILLISHGIELYCWVLSINKTSIFVWSTDPKYITYVLAETTIESDSHTICWPIEVGQPGDTVVTAIHPVFWITKFHRALSRTPKDYSRVLVYFKALVERLSVVVRRAVVVSDEVNTTKGENNV